MKKKLMFKFLNSEKYKFQDEIFIFGLLKCFIGIYVSIFL